MLLPNQVLQVWLHQDVYDQNCKKQARQHPHGPQAEEYIRTKFGFAECDMNDINWESIKKLNQRLSINERATRSKYMFRWSYTNQRNHTFYRQNTARCPLCNIEEEDQHHIQYCKDKAASKMREELLCILEDNFMKLKLHPDDASVTKYEGGAASESDGRYPGTST